MTLLDALETPIDAVITIDLETFYAGDYTLSNMTNESYVRDPRFEVIGVGVKINAGASVWLTEQEFRAWAKTIRWERIAILAHHAHFDGLILSHHFGIIPGFWLDTLSMSRALNGMLVGNSLGDLMPYYGVGHKGHEVVQAKGKRLSDFTPEELAAYGEYCKNDCNGTWGIFQKMLPHFPEVELWQIDTTIRTFTEPVLVLDEPLLSAYLIDERKRKADLLARVAKDKSVFMSNPKFAQLLIDHEVVPPMKISPTTGEETFAFAKSDAGMQILLDHPRDEVRFLAEARVAVKSTTNETRTERFLKSGANGRPVPVYLKYSAAHTHRWGGGDKMNFQNLERTSKKDPRKGTLRKSLLAPDGKVLVVSDSAQIEARKTAWLAGHADLLNAFAQKRDVYSEFATEAYGRLVDRKKNPDDEIPGFVGKICVLGLGFQMGWRKFALTMLAGAMGGPPVKFGQKEADTIGVDVEAFKVDKYDKRRMSDIEKMPTRLSLPDRVIHCAVAKAFVDRYRARNAPIVGLWDTMQTVLKAMCEGEQATFGPGECLQTVRHGIILPNGMKLKYPGLEYKEGKDGERGSYWYLGGDSGKKPQKAYGGSITENIVQALARIVVADQMLWIRTKYPIVTMTHDEVVSLADEADGENALKWSLDCMRVPPVWAPGLPLNAEGGFAVSYGDAK